VSFASSAASGDDKTFVVKPTERKCSEVSSAADWLVIRPEFHAPRADGLLPIAADARVGASSLRRGALLGRFAPQAHSVPLRGNVPTRVRKLAEQAGVDAIILAGAGLSRLKLDLSALKNALAAIG